MGVASFRAAPSILIDPLHEDFGWLQASISSAVSINLLYGLTSPFAAALMERFGMRRVVTAALVLVSAGSELTVFMTATWQLVLLWGGLVGLGTGSMALAFMATVVDRWFVARRGLVIGILTAGSAAGQLVFLPGLALLSEHYIGGPAGRGEGERRPRRGRCCPCAVRCRRRQGCSRRVRRLSVAALPRRRQLSRSGPSRRRSG